MDTQRVELDLDRAFDTLFPAPAATKVPIARFGENTQASAQRLPRADAIRPR